MFMCRACLKTENALNPLNAASVNSYNLLTNLNVKLFDGMPQYFCVICEELLMSFIDFREKSITSEKTLQGMIQNIKPEDDYLQTENKFSAESEVKIEILKNETDSLNDTFNAFNNCYDEGDTKPEIDTKLLTVSGINENSKRHRKLKNKKDKSKKCNKEKKIKKKAIKPGSEIPWACGICVKSFSDDKHLKDHLETHKNALQCQICHESFSTWPALLGHRLDHIPANQGKCHICKKRSKSSIYMEYHYLTKHNDGEEVALTCKNCKKKYGTPTRLRNHMLFLHSEVKYVCDYCSKGFTIKDTLRVHILTHSDHKPLVCDMCGYRCKLQTNLKAHKLRIHSLTKVQCNRCQIVFANQDKHDGHTCRLHEVMCPECGKMLKHSRQLKRHLETHRAVGSHKCDVCPAAYKTREALRVHASRHAGVRGKQCAVCSARFFSSSVLARHRRIHTGEKPYVCTICGRGFSYGGGLKVHMKVHGLFLVSKKDKPTESPTDVFKM